MEVFYKLLIEENYFYFYAEIKWVWTSNPLDLDYIWDWFSQIGKGNSVPKFDINSGDYHNTNPRFPRQGYNSATNQEFKINPRPLKSYNKTTYYTDMTKFMSESLRDTYDNIINNYNSFYGSYKNKISDISNFSFCYLLDFIYNYNYLNLVAINAQNNLFINPVYITYEYLRSGLFINRYEENIDEDISTHFDTFVPVQIDLEEEIPPAFLQSTQPLIEQDNAHLGDETPDLVYSDSDQESESDNEPLGIEYVIGVFLMMQEPSWGQFNNMVTRRAIDFENFQNLAVWLIDSYLIANNTDWNTFMQENITEAHPTQQQILNAFPNALSIVLMRLLHRSQTVAFEISMMRDIVYRFYPYYPSNISDRIPSITSLSDRYETNQNEFSYDPEQREFFRRVYRVLNLNRHDYDRDRDSVMDGTYNFTSGEASLDSLLNLIYDSYSESDYNQESDVADESDLNQESDISNADVNPEGDQENNSQEQPSNKRQREESEDSENGQPSAKRQQLQ